MDALTISGKLGMPEAAALFEPYWERSVLSCPEAEAFHFLRDDELEACARYGCFPEKRLAPLQELAAEIRGNKAWRLWVWHLYRLLFVEQDYPPVKIAQWPYPTAVFGDRAFLVYVLPFLGCVRLIRERHRAIGVPESVTRDTCPNRHLHSNMARFEEAHSGTLGATTKSMYWFRLHVNGRMFRLGRLEYKAHTFPSAVRVFKNKPTGRVLALLSDGCEYNDEGFMEDPEARRPDRRYRRARFVQSETGVEGVPAHPSGRVLARPVMLPLKAWEPVLLPGDPVLDVHIPPGDGLTLPALRASFEQAMAFFARFFPKCRPQAFSSISWMFNPELESMLPAESRLVQFLRQGYLYPRPAKGTEGAEFIFGTDTVNPATAPRDTRLRQALLRKIEAGGSLRNGGFFLLYDHVEDFGHEPYRTQWAPGDDEDVKTRF